MYNLGRLSIMVHTPSGARFGCRPPAHPGGSGGICLQKLSHTTRDPAVLGSWQRKADKAFDRFVEALHTTNQHVLVKQLFPVSTICRKQVQAPYTKCRGVPGKCLSLDLQRLTNQQTNYFRCRWRSTDRCYITLSLRIRVVHYNCRRQAFLSQYFVNKDWLNYIIPTVTKWEVSRRHVNLESTGVMPWFPNRWIQL